MLGLVISALYAGTSYKIVKQFRPQAFTSSDPATLATDVALTAAGALTIAPIVVLGVALKQLAGVGAACTGARR